MPSSWKHDVCGPTTVHLHHEGYLLISLAILTVATFQSVYGEEFGIPGDYAFLFLTVIWLSRHILIRWMCTWDSSTNANPTVRGAITHWIISYCTAGQYFDRPSPQLLARQSGDSRSVSAFTYSSIRYTWNLILVRVVFLFMKGRQSGDVRARTNSKNESFRSAEDTATHQAQPHSFRRKGGGDRESAASSVTGHTRMSPFIQKILQLWNKIAPLIQAGIPACTLIYYTWRLPFATYLFPFAGSGNSDIEDMKWFGSFHKTVPVAWSDVLLVISSFPTIISLLVFTRLITPMVDLVAGSNVLLAVRNEAKAFGGISSKSSKSKKENHESPWIEQNTSIVAQNRLKLIFLVGLLRILENIFLALILPLSGYACRATGHCHAGVQLWQLSTLLFPVGITTPLRTDSSIGKSFDYKADCLSTFLVATSVVGVSALLLLAQAVTLNGSYLAIMGYICGEWVQVEAPSSKNSSNHPSQWDPRRRYKKGDIIVVNGSFWFPRQVFYKATSNSPEGRPFDMFLRATHDMFRNELGHPATSRILAAAIHGHLIFIAVLVVITLGSALIKGNCSNGMLAALVANLVASYGAIGLRRRTELHKLSEEIR